MDLLHQAFWFHGKFLGVEWTAWKVVGWMGNAAFSSRFFVQWYATEKRKQVVVPVLFWWLSLGGSLILLAYALFHQPDSVFIFAYAFAWIPYIRNLMIHHRNERARRACPECATLAPVGANYCHQCGAPLAPSALAASQTR
ncbi:MAG: lipid-A-disaccharide synthase N-terminal domain-containing protein [Limisphaerales bacterium]